MENFGLGKLCKINRTRHPSFCSRLVLLAHICLGSVWSEQVCPISSANGCLEGVQPENNGEKQEKNTLIMYSSAKHLSL